MGSGIEWGIGFGWMAFLYLITGLGGNLLSSVLNPAAFGVGASTAVFGLVGFYVSYLFTNWRHMQRKAFGQIIFLVVYCSVLILVNLNVGPKRDEKVDNWGHLGGLVTGIIAGFAISEALDARDRYRDKTPQRFTEQEYENRPACCKTFCCNFLCWWFLAAWFITLFVLFYTVVDVDVE